jgi:transcriptional regulator GlxA family with amidase domain
MAKHIGIVLFPNVDDLDAMGPKEALGMFAKYSGGEWEVSFVSQDGSPVRAFLGTQIGADHSFDDCPPLDVILVPGGLGTRTEVDSDKLIQFVRARGNSAEWVTSVCTGALVLYRAGFLSGRRATTHWASIQELRSKGDVDVVDDERWVQDGNVITSAGVSAGIDMCLYLISVLKDEQSAANVQRMMEYYPKPPVFAQAKA